MNNLIFTNNCKPYPNQEKNNNKKNKKLDFKKLKNNTCRSLCEVEYFLNDLHRFSNYIKLYKILK